jgi:hypothetical protein
MLSLHAADATITAVTYTGCVNIIDSDASNGAAGYNRDPIPLSVNVSMIGIPFDKPVRAFPVQFRMFDNDGDPDAVLSAQGTLKILRSQ